MHALLFEVQPRAGHEDHYFSHAAALKPVLEQEPGLIFIDRYKSLSRSNIVLSHSLWQDEASLAHWRSNAKHHASQSAGRNKHFADYRIRISKILHRFECKKQIIEWPSEAAYNNPELTTPRYLVFITSQNCPFDKSGECFLSVNFESSFITIVNVDSIGEGKQLFESAVEQADTTSANLCLISRDYGMFNREQAPQYFEPAKS